MKPPAQIRLRLLGRFALEPASEPAAPFELSLRKAMALVGYLAMQPEQSASREELATLLWGNSSDQQARNSLRQALATLRRDLPWPHLFVFDKKSVRLRAGVWSVDAREFDTLTKSTDAEDHVRAGRLFRGEFLAGFELGEEGFDEWLRDQRRRIDLAADRLCEMCATRSRPEDSQEAIALVERLIAIDPLREDRRRWALTLYARYRGKREALAQADAFASLLRHELDTKPEPETRALIEHIRQTATDCVAMLGDTTAFREAISTPTTKPAPLAAEPLALPRPPRPGMVAYWIGRASIAGLAVAALTLSIAILFPASRSATLRVSTPPASDPAHSNTLIADSWKAPPLPTRSGIELRDRSGGIAIVVLPFTTYGEAAGSIQTLADQLTDDLTNVLSRVPGLRVISRQTARSYQGKPVDIAAIGAELGVRYVLEGNIRTKGDRLRVNVELMSPKSRLPIWSDRIERNAADPHAILDEIVGRIGRELQFSVMQLEAERPSADPDVTTLVSRGWSAVFSVGTRGLDGARSGKPYFAQALEREPNNSSAKIGMAAVLITFSTHDLAEDREASLSKAEVLLREALGRNPRLIAGNYFMSVVHRLRGRLQDAIDSLERVIDRNPSHASSYAHLGFVLSRMGRSAEGLEHIRYAMRLSPKDPILSFWLNYEGAAELELARDTEAIEHFRQALALHPRYAAAWAGLAAAFALSGNIDEAKTSAAKLRTLFPETSDEALFARLGWHGSQPLRATEGLRLALSGARTSNREK